MENAAYFHLTTIQIVLGVFALFLLIVFASAIFLDKFWTARSPRSDFDSEHEGNYLRHLSYMNRNRTRQTGTNRTTQAEQSFPRRVNERNSSYN
jgi:hypothetical protein